MAGPARAAAQAPPNKATRDLLALFAEEWDHTLEQNPERASSLGDLRWNNRWSDVSLEAFEKRNTHRQETLKRLQKIDRKRLSADHQLNYDLFAQDLEIEIEEFSHQTHLVPLSQQGGVQTADQLADALSFNTARDYEDWIGRLHSLPLHIRQTTELMREGMRERRVHAKVTMERVPGQLDRQIVEDPEQSPFYRPFTKFAASISGSDRSQLSKAAREVIAANVIPAFREFKAFFTREYLPACLDQPGVWQWPEGTKLYAFLARKFTTTALTPMEIHELGLREVRRIRTEMQAVMDRVQFQGSLQEFFKFLRTDPRFYCASPEELLETYRSVAKRVDPDMVRLFGRLPRIPYGVEPIPEAIAPDTTAAYYREPAADGSRAGTYFVNLHRPDMRPKYEMMALSLHEAVPGHHLQIALAYELEDLPAFRRYASCTAYVEGWGLYAESLGDELGLYDDPYSKFGQLTYEMWRAVRLVVDTGMHHLSWDRQKAIDYFLENAAKTELDVVNEIDRYIAWPGQALAYKIGELKIKELRARAQRELEHRFDVRAFHDTVLESGAVPLDILERRIDAWIAALKDAESGTKPRRP